MNFFRGWEAYRDGFGKLTGEHWLGEGRDTCLPRGRALPGWRDVRVSRGLHTPEPAPRCCPERRSVCSACLRSVSRRPKEEGARRDGGVPWRGVCVSRQDGRWPSWIQRAGGRGRAWFRVRGGPDQPPNCPALGGQQTPEVCLGHQGHDSQKRGHSSWGPRARCLYPIFGTRPVRSRVRAQKARVHIMFRYYLSLNSRSI